ncbi:MAG: protein kinase [Pirellulales bacterium]
MPKPMIPEFWKLLGESGLLPPDRLTQLQDQFAEMKGVSNSNAPVLAEWLISEKALTRYHSDVLLKGLSGPFNYGDFQVIERIRSGRLKGHFRATHLPTQHVVLLSFFSGDTVSDANQWSAALQAAKKAFSVRDAAVTCCHEVVDVGQYKFAVVENIFGRTLSESIQPGTQMPVSQACGIARQVAIGLNALHTTGRPHGNIRPENIWLSDHGQSLLIDFPLVGPTYDGRSPLDLSTVEYAAPELHQLRPEPTPASDIYALGCLLYQLIAGRPPFASSSGEPDSVPKKMARHASEAIVPVHQLVAVPEALNQVVSYMMAKNVSVRHQDGLTVAEALRPFVDPAMLNSQMQQPPTRAAYAAIADQRRESVIGGSAVAAATANSAQPQPPAGAGVSPAANTAAAAITRPSGAPSQVPLSASGLMAATSGAGAVSATAAAGSQPATTTAATQNSAPAASAEELFRLGQQPAVAATPDILPQQSTDAKSEAAASGRMRRSTKNGLIGLALTVGLIGLIFGSLWLSGDSGPGVANKNGDGTGATANDEVSDGQEGTGNSTDAGDGEPPPVHQVAEASGALDVRFIAPDAKILFAVQSSEFFATVAGQQMLASLTASGFDFSGWVRQKTGFALDEIRRLDVALYELPSRVEVALVVWPLVSQDEGKLQQRWANPESTTYNGTTYWRRGELGFYKPVDGTNAFSVAPLAHLREIIDWLDEPARMATTQAMEQLCKSGEEDEQVVADDGKLLWSAPKLSDRHVSVLFSRSYLQSARVALYRGRLAPLHETISWFLGPSSDIQGGMLSLHAGEQFFAELRLYCNRDVLPQVMARDIYRRMGEAPSRLNQHFKPIQFSSYSEQLLADFPFALKALHQYTRHDRDKPAGKQAVLRSYLPIEAATLLIHATDLALLETAGTGGTGPTKVVETQPKTVYEKLKQPTTLRFGRDNLINAIGLLSDDIGVKIEIQDKDLELEGITKNQSFGIDMADKPAEEILLSIVQLANSDKTAKGPSDAAQKLIYVVKEKFNGGEDVIWITTRAGAQTRNDQLPSVFKAQPRQEK